ncbi:MAG: hypothetical protein QXY79_02620, partial [Candidatus Methanomethylicia archaeon]
LQIPSVLADVQLSIKSEEYVFPPSEFQGTKEHPEILTIQNNYIIVEILPNRGLTLWSLQYKPSKQVFLYRESKPLPYLDELTSKYYIEFGGYYPLFPWNKRDNQPLITNFEVIESSPQKVIVYLYGEEIETGVKLEEWITIEDESSMIDIKIRITNLSGKNLSFKFADRLVNLVTSENSEILLPVSSIIVVDSDNDWIGVTGEKISWPQPYSIMKNFIAPAIFTGELEDRYFAIMSDIGGSILIKVWKDDFQTITVRGWGAKYEEAHFKKPVIYLQVETDQIDLKNKESKDFQLRFYILHGLNKIHSIGENGAGYIQLEKEKYETSEEVKLTIGFGSAFTEEKVNAKISLYTLDNKFVKDLSIVEIGSIETSNPAIKELSFKAYGIESGRYILTVDLYSDTHNIVKLTTPIEFISRGISINTILLMSVLIAVLIAVPSIVMYRKRLKKIM